MLNVKELFENLSDQEKEELRNLLLHHTDDVKDESPKEDTYANIAIIDPLQQKEEVEPVNELSPDLKVRAYMATGNKAMKAKEGSPQRIKATAQREKIYKGISKTGPERAKEKNEEVETQAPEVKEPEAKDADLTVSEKQEFLVKFGYDPTNVKYMNTDILGQAYDSAMRIKDAEAGGETITAIGTGLPSEGR
jgi:hypothetical protein